MSGPTNVVMPVAIQQSLPKNTHSQDQGRQEVNGPLKEIMAHQDSLYKYISWEDPVRTLGSYIGALSILLGLHYLPLTRLALKAVTMTLGGLYHDPCTTSGEETHANLDLIVICATEFSSRLFGPNTVLSRLRPKQYQKIPESTLNATLKDIHDLVQYIVVQVQRIIFGQDLDKTFAAFLSFMALFWLIKVVAPFGLTVLGLTSLYLAPLVISPGREEGHDATGQVDELATVAAEKDNTIATEGNTKTKEWTSKAQEATMGPKRRTGGLDESGKHVAADLSTQTGYPASGVSGGAAENIGSLPEMGTNTISKGPGIAKPALSYEE